VKPDVHHYKTDQSLRITKQWLTSIMVSIDVRCRCQWI